MPHDEIRGRLKLIRESLGLSQTAMSEKIGGGKGTWQNIEAGNNPPNGTTLLAIAGLGFNPGWILTGIGPMRLADTPIDRESVETAIDRELMGRVVDSIARLYRELAISLSPVDLGRLSAEKYEEIAAASSDPAERMAMVKLMAVQLRKELLAPPQADVRKDRA
ncbi:Uncharacterised protein [Starkeya nomas]|uniref:HTH cro/C1-type domain-containing protein n=1 Tax=Starkeya nomas TaxID=2666134 RepID=A0A5S9NF96_9HYPH|nr:Uncharacterised protein [Starkeya nomas]